jgi:hypothetical protein
MVCPMLQIFSVLCRRWGCLPRAAMLRDSIDNDFYFLWLNACEECWRGSTQNCWWHQRSILTSRRRPPGARGLCEPPNNGEAFWNLYWLHSKSSPSQSNISLILSRPPTRNTQGIDASCFCHPLWFISQQLELCWLLNAWQSLRLEAAPALDSTMLAGAQDSAPRSNEATA